MCLNSGEAVADSGHDRFMTGFGKQNMAVLVLREADDIDTVLRRALDTASAEERPGLERAVALTAEAGAVPDAELRGRWALRRMASTGYDGPPGTVAAIKALRTAERGLSLLQAVNLSKDAEAVRAMGSDAPAAGPSAP
ncbi:hypothetical protein FHX80_111635 [Streptomyces brevispora]|uniref:Uncharacterized protein n=2 Tax=Streptomyces brevispora TaxID=887462 RepID=A0A561UV29_9ACTN|nr:hypothetical protein FHX80_111635 [Streptomyces brevispora]